MNEPIFIVGASRSGTTMLRLILNAHSRVAIPNELKYFSALPAHIDLKDWRAPGLSPAQYRQLVRAFLRRSRSIFEEAGIEEIERRILSSSRRDLRAPYRLAAEAWAQHHGKTRWGEKTPRNLFYVDILNDMFPAARFIHLVRDPRAVANSMNGIQYFSNDTALNSLNWRHSLTEGIALLESSVPAPRRLMVRYEDLVSDPEQHTKRLCAFINEPFEPGMLNFHRETEKYMDTIRTPSITQPVRKANATKWKQGLSHAEVGVVELICRREMEQFGYEPTGAAPGLSGHVNRAVKQVYWQVQRRRHPGQRGFVVAYPMLERTRNRLRTLLTNTTQGKS